MNFTIDEQNKTSIKIDKKLLDLLNNQFYFSNNPIKVGDIILFGFCKIENETKIITFCIDEINTIYLIEHEKDFFPTLKIK